MSSQFPQQRPAQVGSHLQQPLGAHQGTQHDQKERTAQFATHSNRGNPPQQPPHNGGDSGRPSGPPSQGGNTSGERFAKLDGVTHINVYTLGKTELGKGLAHFTFSPFKHPYYGPFNSMEGFWYFIKAKEPDDALRNLAGYKAKEYGKKLPGRFRENFKEIIVEANFHKIEQNARLKQLMIESVLPFDHYYLYGPGNLLIRPKGFEWLVDGFEHIRELLRSGRAPDPVNYNT